MIKLLDDICEMAVQLSVHIVYRYDGYCCICYDENMEIGGLILLVYLSFLLGWYIFSISYFFDKILEMFVINFVKL
jgi:hypothetical protein